MVLKAQVFSTDIITALLIIMIICSLIIIKQDEIMSKTISNYQDFQLQKRLLQASELLITTSDKGLAKYENNAVKHHEINLSKKINQSHLLLDNYETCITINDNNCAHFPNKITRFAVCEGEICKVEISARSY